MPRATEDAPHREPATRMVRVIPRHHAMLQTIAAAEGRSYTEVLIRALDEWQRIRGATRHLEEWLRTQQTEAETILSKLRSDSE